MNLAYAAEQYADRGWRIFPLSVRSKMPWAETKGHLEATHDPAIVRDWWRHQPQSNIGCVPGPRHLVADLDTEKAKSIAIGLGLLDTPTLTCQTGRDGYKGQHLYFQHPGGEIANKRLAIQHGALALVDGRTPALEIKADHGYVVVPPSIHPSGRQYKWETHEQIQPLPELARLAVLTEHSARPAIGDVIHEGSRDIDLFAIAGAMRRLGCGEDMIRTALHAINRGHTRPPLPEHVVDQKAKGVTKYPPAPATTTTAPSMFGKRRDGWQRQ